MPKNYKTFWELTKNSKNQELFIKNPHENSLQKIDNPLLAKSENEVENRGFSLYEYISVDELKSSLMLDYLSLITRSSTPLAIVTFIAGIIGLLKGMSGVFLAIFGVLAVYYFVIFCILTVRMFLKWKIFSEMASVVLTDDFLVSGGNVIEKNNFTEREKKFAKIEKTFHEPLFGKSNIAKLTEIEKQNLKEKLKTLISGGGKIFQTLEQNVGHNRDGQQIMIYISLVLTATGAIFGLMMGITYFLGLPIIWLLAIIFAKIFKKILLLKNAKEYKIQDFFEKIDSNSRSLQSEKTKIIAEITEAKNNNWQENLSGKIHENFVALNLHTKKAINESLTLKKILENSEKYAKIFNFGKYDTWIKNEILAPILELLDLTEKNILLLKNTKTALEKQISETNDPSHRTPLELQQTRLQAKILEFEQMQKTLENYREKLEK